MARRSLPLLAAPLFALAACDRAQQPVEPADLSPLAAAHADGFTPSSISLDYVTSFGKATEGAAEIPAFDAGTKRLFVVNGAQGSVDVYDLANPASPLDIGTITVPGEANSVAVYEGLVAVAVANADKTLPGQVALFDAASLDPIGAADVGALPDMLIFTPDGTTVLVANEGEPNDDYTVDPVGSVSIVDVRNPASPSVRTASFSAFDGREDELRKRGVRIFGPGASASRDFEPEYIALSADGRTAWVSLQENNALAIVDVAGATVTDVVPLGYKLHRNARNGLDASDRDGGINIQSWPVFGMYQPDGIAAYSANGRTYIVTANEGDARDYDGFAEEERVRDLDLNPAKFSNGQCRGPCRDADKLGRLTVTTTLGFDAKRGVYDELYAFGARSFSIRDARGHLVWDSGDAFERITAAAFPAIFNASNEDPAESDNRSDNKGPEPEGVALATFGAKTFAFIGLERIGGVMVYDVTNPNAPRHVTYVNSRLMGDLGPEGLVVIPAADSPTGEPLLVIGNEVSGTSTIYRIALQ